MSKAEALAWKTCHLALWPVVIEIAYAKHLKSMLIKNKDQIEKSMRTSMRPLIKQQVKQYYVQPLGRDPSDSELEETVEEAITEELKNLLDQNSDLRTMFKDGGIPSVTLTYLTGAKSKQKIFANANMDITKLIPDLDEKLKQEYQNFKGVDISGIKAFQGKYSPEALKIYDKIQKKLNSGKIITAGFKGVNPLVATSMLSNTGLPKTDNNEIAFTTIQLAKSLKVNPLDTIDDLTLKDSLKKETYEKWLKDHKLNLADLGTPKVTDEMRKKFILETVDFEKKLKISKTKSGIGAAHGYLVLDAFEHEGYLYIVLKNPHDVKTKINYKKSKKLPPEVKLPEQISKIKNECMMELNHFYKKLSAINYDK